MLRRLKMKSKYLIEIETKLSNKQTMISHASINNLMSKKIFNHLNNGQYIILRDNETKNILFQGCGSKNYMDFIIENFESNKPIYNDNQMKLHYITKLAINYLYDAMFVGFPDEKFSKCYDDLILKYESLLEELKYDAKEPKKEDYPIDDLIENNLNLPIRIQNCLYRNGIKTMDQLCNLTLEDLCKIKNIGQLGIRNLFFIMHQAGYKFKGEK